MFSFLFEKKRETQPLKSPSPEWMQVDVKEEVIELEDEDSMLIKEVVKKVSVYGRSYAEVVKGSQ